jgi:hypothetical protein
MEERPQDAEAQARELMLALRVRVDGGEPVPLFEELPDRKLVLPPLFASQASHGRPGRVPERRGERSQHQVAPRVGGRWRSR